MYAAYHPIQPGSHSILTTCVFPAQLCAGRKHNFTGLKYAAADTALQPIYHSQCFRLQLLSCVMLVSLAV